jgi:hypothetical protein
MPLPGRRGRTRNRKSASVRLYDPSAGGRAPAPHAEQPGSRGWNSGEYFRVSVR